MNEKQKTEAIAEFSAAIESGRGFAVIVKTTEGLLQMAGGELSPDIIGSLDILKTNLILAGNAMEKASVES